LLLAEGEGRNAVWVAERGMTVTAVDLSSVGMEKAAKLARDRGVSVTTVTADLAAYDLGENRWDCIAGAFCHLPPPVRTRVLAAIPGALRPGGYFVLEAYTPAQVGRGTGGPPVPELMYTADILREALADKLAIQRNEELERNVVEGKYHNGMSSVVQFLAKKEKV
jgi:SAM-dependent methyltransferase